MAWQVQDFLAILAAFSPFGASTETTDLLTRGHSPVERVMSMAICDARPQPAENQLLAALSLEERERLLPLMQVVQLKRNQTIQLSGEAIGSVYFPATAMLALVSILEDGSCTGLGMVGRGGMSGVSVLLGADSTPFALLVLIAGTAYRIRAGMLDAEINLHGSLEHLLRLYTQGFMNQVAQGIACARHHTLRQRMACWLLMMRDGLGVGCIPVTHEFLGQMLGVGRPSVTLTAAGLQGDRLIHYRRGVITITDAPGLEVAACECYHLIIDEYEHLLGAAGSRTAKPRVVTLSWHDHDRHVG